MPSHVSDTLAPLVMSSKELVKAGSAASDWPAATARSASTFPLRRPSFIVAVAAVIVAVVVVVVVLARRAGGGACCAGPGPPTQ